MENRNTSEDLGVAQLTKINLEIKQLEANNTLVGKISRFLPTISTLVAVGGFLLGIWSLNNQSEKENQLREKEFKKVFWEKQLNLYNEISNSAARLVTLENKEEIEKEYTNFKQLYHGTAIMYMDDSVAIALKNFIEFYIDYREDISLQVKAQEKSRLLANTCRQSLQRNWDVPLKKINLTRYQ